MAKNMGTKTQTFSLAKRLGCTIEFIGGDWVLTPPAGQLLDGTYHYSSFPYPDYLLGEIWSAFIDEMQKLTVCNCGCGSE